MLFLPGPDFVRVLSVEPVEYTDLCDPIKLGVFLPGVDIMISKLAVNTRYIKCVLFENLPQSQSIIYEIVFFFSFFKLIILQTVFKTISRVFPN